MFYVVAPAGLGGIVFILLLLFGLQEAEKFLPSFLTVSTVCISLWTFFLLYDSARHRQKLTLIVRKLAFPLTVFLFYFTNEKYLKMINFPYANIASIIARFVIIISFITFAFLCFCSRQELDKDSSFDNFTFLWSFIPIGLAIGLAIFFGYVLSKHNLFDPQISISFDKLIHSSSIKLSLGELIIYFSILIYTFLIAILRRHNIFNMLTVFSTPFIICYCVSACSGESYLLADIHNKLDLLIQILLITVPLVPCIVAVRIINFARCQRNR